MKMLKLFNLILVLCLVGITVSPAMAFNSFGSSWRNFYPDTCQELQDFRNSD